VDSAFWSTKLLSVKAFVLENLLMAKEATFVETVLFALAGAALAALVDMLVKELYVACRKRLRSA
jgi:hypothetical protein